MHDHTSCRKVSRVNEAEGILKLYDTHSYLQAPGTPIEGLLTSVSWQHLKLLKESPVASNPKALRACPS